MALRAVIRKGDKLDTKEQTCLAHCQDRYLAARVAITESLQKRQSSEGF
jgi:Tim10/DDP family zinc finger